MKAKVGLWQKMQKLMLNCTKIIPIALYLDVPTTLIRTFLLSTILFALTGYRAYAQTDQKLWSQDSVLTWSDYKGTLDTISKFSATTVWHIHYTYKYIIKNGQRIFTFKTEAMVFRDKSWSIAAHQSDRLLAHEQLHFNIAELYARELLVALNSATYTDDYKKEIKEIFDTVFSTAKQVQVKYDEDSSHSKNKLKQAEWELYINKLLAETSH